MICDEHTTDPRVKVVHQENRGLSAARNVGLNMTTGEYIAFLDSDDAYFPEMIQQMIGTLIETNSDLVGCCSFSSTSLNSMAMDHNLRRVGASNAQELSAKEAIESMLEGHFVIAVWNKLYPRHLWDNLRFVEDHVYEDIQATTLALERCNRVVLIPQPLIYHRERNNSITYTNTLQNLQDFLMAHQFLIEYSVKSHLGISHGSIQTHNNDFLRVMILKWAELCSLEPECGSGDVAEKLESEIQTLASEVEILSAKTKMVWRLYRLCPSMILPFQKCYLGLKNLFYAN